MAVAGPKHGKSASAPTPTPASAVASAAASAAASAVASAVASATASRRDAAPKASAKAAASASASTSKGSLFEPRPKKAPATSGAAAPAEEAGEAARSGADAHGSALRSPGSKNGSKPRCAAPPVLSAGPGAGASGGAGTAAQKRRAAAALTAPGATKVVGGLDTSPMTLREGQSLAAVSALEGPDVRCMAMVVLPDSCHVWCGERDGSIAVRALDSAAVVGTVPQDESVHDFVWALVQAGGAVWVGTSSGRLRVYDAAKRRLRAERCKHLGGIYALTPVGQSMYSAANDFKIVEWDIQTCDATGRIFSDHTNQVRCLCACAGSLASGSDDQTIRVWDLHKAEASACHTIQHGDGVLSLAYVPVGPTTVGRSGEGGALWAGDNSGAINVYALPEGQVVRCLRDHTGPVFCLMRRQGLIFSSSADMTLKVWDPAEGTCLRTLQVHTSYVAAVCSGATALTTQLWSASADRILRTWSLEHRSNSHDSFEHALDESESRAAALERLGAELAAAQSAEAREKQEAEALRGALAEERQRREAMEQELLAHLEEHRTTTRRLEEEHSQAKVTIERGMTHAVQLESQLENLTNEVGERQQREVVMEGASKEEKVRAEHVVRRLDEATKALRVKERENKELQDQIDGQAESKSSRIALCADVVSVQRLLGDAKKVAHSLAKVHAPKVPTTTAISVRGPVLRESDYLLGAVSKIRDAVHALVCRHLSDEEKRHLGIANEQADNPMSAPSSAVSTPLSRASKRNGSPETRRATSPEPAASSRGCGSAAASGARAALAAAVAAASAAAAAAAAGVTDAPRSPSPAAESVGAKKLAFHPWPRALPAAALHAPVAKPDATVPATLPGSNGEASLAAPAAHSAPAVTAATAAPASPAVLAAPCGEEAVSSDAVSVCQADVSKAEAPTPTAVATGHGLLTIRPGTRPSTSPRAAAVAGPRGAGRGLGSASPPLRRGSLSSARQHAAASPRPLEAGARATTGVARPVDAVSMPSPS